MLIAVVALSVLCLVLGVSTVSFFKRNEWLIAEKDAAVKDAAQVEMVKSRLAEVSARNEALNADIMRLTAENAALDVKMREESRHLNERVEELKQMKDALTVQFKAVSSDVLKNQAENQKTLIGQTLAPFRDQLTAFQKGMDDFRQVHATDKGRLDEQLKNLLDMNNKLSSEAKNLTNALKGNTKYQGDWGETQLERLFEITGLRRGEDYSVQENVKDEDGRNKRPDYIVNLPGDRRLIVDCKVSLNAYMRYANADTPEARQSALVEHVKAVRDHVKELASKNYQTEVKNAGLDYVFMFIPVEHAYIEALRADPTIYETAYQNRIAVTTASSLLPILRTVENMWRIEKQNKNVQQIAEIGGKLYDKLAGFVDDMKDIDKALDKAKTSYGNAFKKLSEGKGNALGWAEKLKDQGAKITKELQAPDTNTDAE